MSLEVKKEKKYKRRENTQPPEDSAHCPAQMFMFSSLAPPPATSEPRPRPHNEVPGLDSPKSPACPRDSLTSQSLVSHGTARNKDGRDGLGEGTLIRKPGTRRDSKGRVAAAARSGAWRRAAAAAAVAATATPAGVVGHIRESWNAWLKFSSPGSSSGKERRSVGGLPG